MGLNSQDSLLQVLAAEPSLHVILLDTYETLALLDKWLCEKFLPQLPENTLIVIAGRHAPTSA